MATYWGGQYGYAIFTPTSGSPLTVANINWNSDEQNRLAEVTNAGSAGHAQWIGTVNESDGSFDVVWDSTNTPRSGGLYPGNTGTITLYYGNSGASQAQAVILGKMSKKLDTRQGAIMYNVAYKGTAAITGTS